MLDKLLQAPYNTQQSQLANFWKGEIAYRNGNTDNAIFYFNNYLLKPQTNGEVNLNNAKYNFAYCLLKKENYKDALTNFEQVANNVTSSSSAMEQDAYLRSADCYFMQKYFTNALKVYDDVIYKNFKSADYATYQKAVIAGALGKQTDKIYLLQSLPKQYPSSTFAGEALMEIANTYIAAEDYEKAIFTLQDLVKNKAATQLNH